ncbi:hypothetical protein ERO13_D07G163200v2 [Gossypium hirsutum]|uniref:Chromatin modification-related protein EAF1 B isoform X1 n=1 Tax=Gossypium hirsutum TaxID=3635 RepID=A0A1U8P8H6_GOSHI|nr:chromatin modification-related protein EAF1 B-like isoform X1 [Gossypium hirsutum]XP_040952454.1 chromatin modification-related protein EAF1 B-like isoform X1 [Gossypium hirsutum]XP_040952455.1 chromatin modification-related protein EAF1 B-like isoform X1 [Gossypium hirsutum]KAG4138937.1 hypothetical protein ERO13_D07G163200v2 [Gossypium hirsutum]KAG4138938.1 hypothetical protein ERO13_D07G163200v2 [Gossypium hirsutum]
MHGCNSGPALLVIAEIGSMGRVVDGGVGIDVKTSPCRAAIEKAQAELRQEYDVREERRRELEFLEKGGNPLDFKFGNAASVSVQSISFTDQQAELLTCEAKGSFAPTISPHGDSIESSGRPRVPAICEPNSADNLLLFDGENELPGCERKSMHPHKRNNVVPSEQSSQINGTRNAKESEDSAIFRPYARRNRSKKNRDGVRSCSTDMVQGQGGHGSLSAHIASKDLKTSTCEKNDQKDKNIPYADTPKSAISNLDLASRMISPDNLSNMECGLAVEETTDQSKCYLSESKVDVTASKSFIDDLPNEPAQLVANGSTVKMASEEPDLVGRKEQVVPTGLESSPGTGAAAANADNETSSNQLNEFIDPNRDMKNIPNEGKNYDAAIETKGLDSESSCTQNSLNTYVNNGNDVCINPENIDSNGKPVEQTSRKEESLNSSIGELAKETNEIKAVDNAAVVPGTITSVSQKHTLSFSIVKVVEEIRSELQNELTCPSNNEVQRSSHAVSEADRKISTVPADNSNSNKETFPSSKPLGSMDNAICEVPEVTLSERTSTPIAETQSFLDNHVKVVDKAHEDSILEEAQIIQAKQKRIAELSVGTSPWKNHQKSHWEFVLEEMTWMANDFAQERLWKMMAAAQISRHVAFTSRLKFEEQHQYSKLKKVALSLANAVMDFWHSAEVLLNRKDASLGPKKSGHDLVHLPANEVPKNMTAKLDMDMNEDQQHFGKNSKLAIQAYALRFLKYSSSSVSSPQAEAPATPDRISDSGIIDISWDENLTEESLFYAVPLGAMETYRRSIESYLIQTEKTGSSKQEEVEISVYDAGAEFGYDDFECDEEEGETSTYYLPGAFEDSKSSKLNQKKWKKIKSYLARPYEMGADFPHRHCAQQSMLIRKRPASSLNVNPIPMKRVRTGSRQRVLSPFSSAPAAGGLQGPTKTDASSGDTNSFQDDQNALNEGFQIQKSMEVESIMDLERQLPYDHVETPVKPTKKKKAKNLGSAYNQSWQLESTVHNEKRDYSKKRLESHHFDSNGTSDLYGQHNAKKLKIMKQQPDNAFDFPPSGTIPFPAGSQKTNMSNPSKIIRLIHGCDKGRNAKTHKMSVDLPGSGGSWSLFEDQALVVLVHDMGPNWEIVSDAINSTLQFKCIFRKPKECKERHKILMDRNGDGADSADDSGSLSYTLPGIPKGSARQLFQHLQGPMEEDILKSHFEKIMLIGKKQQYRRSQDPKQIVPDHNSHVIALSKICPNNRNGGVLMPLELCDVIASSQDVVPVGYQASHAGGLAISNQGVVGSMPPASGANSSLQGSSGVVHGSNISSASAPLNGSMRNMQQSNLSLPGAVSGSDRGVRMVPNKNGVGMTCGISRSMSLSRPGLRGMASSTMLNSSCMLSNLVGMPSPVNIPSGPGSGHGNSMLRPHDTMHMMREQGNSQGIPAFNGLSSAYTNQSTAPPVFSYPVQPQQQQQMPPQQSHALNNSHHAHHQGYNHVSGSQQQAYAMCLTKERQVQQQQQPQQQFAVSSALMPNVQPQTQLPISSLQNGSQIQSQASTQPGSLSPLTPSSPTTPMSLQQQHKHQLAPHGLGRNPQPGATGLNKQIGKQRQRQPQQQQQFQQSGRHHPQQRQQTQSQQQAKLSKGVGRGNMLVHQNPSGDPAHLNSLGVVPGNQAAKNREQMMHLIQGKGLCSRSGLSPVQQSKALVSSQSSNCSEPQQKIFSGAAAPSTKKLQQVAPHSDNISQMVPSDHMPSAVHQSVLPAAMGPNHQHSLLQSKTHQKQVNLNRPAVHRMLQRSQQVNFEPPNKSQVELAHADKQTLNSAPQMGTTTTMEMPQAAIDSANNAVSVVSPAGLQWKSPEPEYGPAMPTVATEVGSIGSPLTDSMGNDPVPLVSQGLGQRQLSGCLPPDKNNVGAQWTQQPQTQRSHIPPPTQQHFQSQEQSQQD